MKQFEAPEIKIEKFEIEDVITTSVITTSRIDDMTDLH